jgi:acetyl esterase/lipase
MNLATRMIRVHVGHDEELLDDSLRYVERVVAAGVDPRVDMWEGMPYGFLSGIGTLRTWLSRATQCNMDTAWSG